MVHSALMNFWKKRLVTGNARSVGLHALQTGQTLRHVTGLQKPKD
jgi:hypothetical protein